MLTTLIVGWAMIPNFPTNEGWRYFVYTMGAITLVMFFCRFALFHLYESPKVRDEGCSLETPRRADAIPVPLVTGPASRGCRNGPWSRPQEPPKDVVDRGDPE